MAIARRLLSALGALAVPLAAAAAPRCDDERAHLGFAVEAGDGGLRVLAVVADTAAGRAGLREGDVILQANALVPRSCAHWNRAVRDAREERKALLILVDRAGVQVPLALPPSTWDRPAVETAGGPEADVPGAPDVAREAASAVSPPVAPPPLPPEVPVSLEGVLAALDRLANPEPSGSDAVAYEEAVREARRQVETLAARGATTAARVAALRRAVRHFEAAAVAWEAIDGPRRAERRSRRLPVAENRTVPYFADSPAAAIIDEFDFLEATVAREPTTGSFGFESAGSWRPVWARLLLWERGARAVTALRESVQAGR